MAVPAVAAQLIVLIYNLADTFYVGRTNNPFMVAGVSLILPLFNVAVAVGALFGAGGGALLPRLLAVDRKDEATRVSAYCLRLGLLTAAAFALLILLFMRPLLHLLGAGENTFGYARQYVLMVLVLGGIPTICSNVLSNLIRSLGLSRESGIGVALGGVLNLALDPLFMFVILPKGCEVLGVGIATLLSGIISCAYCLFVFRKKQKVIGVNLTAPLPETESRRKVFLVGIPSSIGGLLFDLDYMVLDKLMSGYGDIPLAAIGIVLKAERLPQQTGIGLCQAMVPLVAYSYAKRDFRRVRRIMARCEEGLPARPPDHGPDPRHRACHGADQHHGVRAVPASDHASVYRGSRHAGNRCKIPEDPIPRGRHHVLLFLCGFPVSGDRQRRDVHGLGCLEMACAEYPDAFPPEPADGDGRPGLVSGHLGCHLGYSVLRHPGKIHEELAVGSG